MPSTNLLAQHCTGHLTPALPGNNWPAAGRLTSCWPAAPAPSTADTTAGRSDTARAAEILSGLTTYFQFSISVITNIDRIFNKQILLNILVLDICNFLL